MFTYFNLITLCAALIGATLFAADGQQRPHRNGALYAYAKRQAQQENRGYKSVGVPKWSVPDEDAARILAQIKSNDKHNEKKIN